MSDAHFEALQGLLGLVLVTVALIAVDWRLGVAAAGVVILLDAYLGRLLTATAAAISSKEPTS